MVSVCFYMYIVHCVCLRKWYWYTQLKAKLFLVPNHLNMIEQKGMTFEHNFCYFILRFFISLFVGGRRKGKRITKVVVKSHAFLLDLSILDYYILFPVKLLLLIFFASFLMLVLIFLIDLSIVIALKSKSNKFSLNFCHCLYGQERARNFAITRVGSKISKLKYLK